MNDILKIAFFDISLSFLKDVTKDKRNIYTYEMISPKITGLFQSKPNIINVPKSNELDTIPFLKIDSRHYRLNISRKNVRLGFVDEGTKAYTKIEQKNKDLFIALYNSFDKNIAEIASITISTRFFIPHLKPMEKLLKLSTFSPISLHKGHKIRNLNMSFQTGTKYISLNGKKIDIHNDSKLQPITSPKNEDGFMLLREIHTKHLENTKKPLNIDPINFFDFYTKQLNLDNYLHILL